MHNNVNTRDTYKQILANTLYKLSECVIKVCPHNCRSKALQDFVKIQFSLICANPLYFFIFSTLWNKQLLHHTFGLALLFKEETPALFHVKHSQLVTLTISLFCTNYKIIIKFSVFVRRIYWFCLLFISKRRIYWFCLLFISKRFKASL